MINPLYISHPTTVGKTPDVWANPNDNNKRTMNGANVQGLGNKSIGLSDFVELTASRQPLYQSNGINGLGAIESRDSFSRLKSDNSVASSSPVYTATFGWMHTIDPTPPGYIFTVAFTSSHVYILAFDDVTERFLSRSWTSGLGFFGAFYSSNSFSRNIPVIVTVIYDSPNSQTILRVNGSQEGSTSSVISAACTDYDINLLAHWTDGAYLSMPGQRFGEFMANAGSLPTIEQIRRRERYLANYYNVSI